MGIEHINRLGWIIIGAIVGCAIGLAMSASGSGVEGFQRADLADFERDLVQKDPKSGNPLVRRVTVHPPEFSPTDDAEVREVSYQRLAMTKDGRYGWLEKRVVAKIPFVPARRGNVVPASDLTIEKYLDSVAQQHDFVRYSTGWWLIPRNAAITGTAIGVVVLGGIWPTLLALMSGAGFGRKHNPKYKDDRPLWRVRSTAKAPAGRPVASAAEMTRVQSVADAYEQNLTQFATEGSHASTASSTADPEVRKLNAQALEEAKLLPNPDADDEIEVKGEYYPVLFHHKKHEDEADPNNPHPKKDGH